MEKKISLENKSFQEKIKIWIMAARPKTLTASFVPIVVGTLLSTSVVPSINWILAIFTLFSALLIHVGINLINDAWDFRRGADNENRLGFIRVTQMGLLSSEEVMRGACVCFGLALALGIPLMMHSGWPLVLVLLTSCVFGYFYTGGPYPLAYWGLGELFVLLFYGWVCTMTPYFIQTGKMGLAPFIAGTQIGLLGVAMIAINNLRDIKGDKEANKKTLAVLFGVKFARIEISIVWLLPFLLGIYWALNGAIIMAVLPLVLVKFAFHQIRLIWNLEPSREYNSIFVSSALIHFLFGVLFTIGYIFR